MSYTELEFGTATEAGLPRLVFVLDTDADDTGIPVSRLIDQEFGGRQEAFRSRVRDSALTVQSFASPAGLGQLVERSLRELAEARSGGGRGPGPPTVVGDVPQEPTGFQPRADLLAELDAPSGGRVRVVHAVTGMRGVGKTQLAAAYARARIDDRWRLVAWVNAESTAAVLGGLAEVAAALGLDAGAGDSVAAGRAVRRRLEARGDRCLLVFDNATDPADLLPFLPAAGAARVLVTSNEQPVGELGAGVAVDAAEAALVPGVRVIAVDSLTGAADWLRGLPGPDGQPAAVEYQGGQDLPSRPGRDGKLASGGGAQAAGPGSALAPDLAELLGQSMARRAAEVCAAGGHHLSLLGPPGAGKTMLAERIPTILPRLDRAAAFEVTAVHSVAGTLPAQVPLLEDPPFLAPHHTATKAAIVGGGSGVIRPGSASLAHRGVLFLDEAPEFARDVLDALRQPLEAGEVVVARSGITTRFPARFTLVLAANPCPCARVAGPSEGCSCSPATRRRYLGRISGPLLDRVDVKIELEPVSRKELLSDRTFSESSLTVARRVAQARQRAAHRLQGTPWRLNGEVPGSALRRTWPPAPGSLAVLERSLDRGLITARGVVKIVRVAWTLADLAGRPRPTRDDCDAALGLWLGVRR